MQLFDFFSKLLKLHLSYAEQNSIESVPFSPVPSIHLSSFIILFPDCFSMFGTNKVELSWVEIRIEIYCVVPSLQILPNYIQLHNRTNSYSYFQFSWISNVFTTDHEPQPGRSSCRRFCNLHNRRSHGSLFIQANRSMTSRQRAKEDQWRRWAMNTDESEALRGLWWMAVKRAQIVTKIARNTVDLPGQRVTRYCNLYRRPTAASAIQGLPFRRRSSDKIDTDRLAVVELYSRTCRSI